MSMIRKDFVRLANEIGTAVKRYGLCRENAGPEVTGIIEAVMVSCRAANYGFSDTVFEAHLWDVAEGRRDRNGRKVKVSR